MPEEQKGSLLPHNCILEDRRHLNVSGVKEVLSFDEASIVVLTEMGELTVKGEKLHITRLTLEVGELTIEGKISSLSYQEVLPQSGSFFSRVFR